MFSCIGLRLAARSIPSILSTARPTLSRTLFVSHFQTRSFVTTSPLAQAAAVTATRTARKISAKTKSSTTKKKKKPIAAKKPLVKKKKKIIKKTPAKKAPSVLHFSSCLFALSLKGCVVVVPRSMSMPPLRPVSGYVVFLREHIASLPKGYGTEVMRQRFKDTAGLWQALPEHAKEVGRYLGILSFFSLLSCTSGLQRKSTCAPWPVGRKSLELVQDHRSKDFERNK
jgi:hypothetical protein